MPDKIALRIGTDTITDGLQKVAARGKAMKPVMASIGEAIISGIEDNFAKEGAYSEEGSWRGGSKKWRDLSAATIKRRGKAHPILQDTGRMASSITSQASETSVVVGTNMEYAAAQNFGVDKTVKVPAYLRQDVWGGQSYVKGHSKEMKLPARPFMTVSDATIKEITETIGDYLVK